MLIQLTELFRIFAEHHDNLMLVYPTNHERSEIDINQDQMLDDIPCFYPSQGETTSCHMVVAISTTNNTVRVTIDPEPQLKLNVPLFEYSVDDAIDSNLDDLVTAVTNALQLTFEMSLSEFKSIYTKTKLKET